MSHQKGIEVCVEVIKSRWKPAEGNGNRRKLLWKLAEVGESRWKSVKIGARGYGSSSKSTEPNGSWRSMGVCRVDMEVDWIRWK